MSPLGKFLLAIGGLRFFGAEGLVCGLLLGHVLIDRTIVIKKIEQMLATLDDNIRIMLPYKYYRFYNRIEGKIRGKLICALIGLIFFGFDGFIAMFLVGHCLFDWADGQKTHAARKAIDMWFDRNLAKLCGAVLGFVLHSGVLVFCGILIGFFIDYYRVENAAILPWHLSKGFWQRCNPLKWWFNSKEARHVAYIRAVAGLAAQTAQADGDITDNEIRIFKKLFVITEEENSKAAQVFRSVKGSRKELENYAYQIRLIAKDNLPLKESVVDNLFKIAAADGCVTEKAFALLREIARLIELPEGNFRVIEDIYKPKSCNDSLAGYYEVLGVEASVSDDAIKKRWKELIIRYHPDKAQSLGASSAEIERATLKMAEINHAYQTIMKSRRCA